MYFLWGNSKQELWDETQCQACFDIFEPDQLFIVPGCHHVSCRNCMTEYVKSQIYDGIAYATCISCENSLELHDIRDFLQNDDMFKEYEAMVRISKCGMIFLIFYLILSPIIAIGDTIIMSLTQTARLIESLRRPAGFNTVPFVSWEQVPFVLISIFSPFLLLGFMIWNYFTSVRSTFGLILRQLTQSIQAWKGLSHSTYTVHYNAGYAENTSGKEGEICSGDNEVEDGISNGHRTRFFTSLYSSSKNRHGYDMLGVTSEDVNQSNTQFTHDIVTESKKSSHDAVEIDMLVAVDNDIELEHIVAGDIIGDSDTSMGNKKTTMNRDACISVTSENPTLGTDPIDL